MVSFGSGTDGDDSVLREWLCWVCRGLWIRLRGAHGDVRRVAMCADCRGRDVRRRDALVLRKEWRQPHPKKEGKRWERGPREEGNGFLWVWCGVDVMWPLFLFVGRTPCFL